MYNKPFLIKMKLSQLKQIIKEEIKDSLNEAPKAKSLTIQDIAQACIERLYSEDFKWLQQPGLKYQNIKDQHIENARKAFEKARNYPDLARSYYKMGFEDRDIARELVAAITKTDLE
jgi:hypothetical protein